MRANLLLVSAGEDEAVRMAFMLKTDPAMTYEINHVKQPSGARIALAETRFDAILFDLTAMGKDWCADIRNFVADAITVPIIVFTETESEEDGIAAVNAGAQDCVVKSRVSSDSLRRIIRYSIERSQFQRKLDRLAQQTLLSQRMEEAWRESQYRIRAITESLFEGVLVTDIDGYVVFSNRSADTLLGSDKVSRISGRFIDQVFKLSRGDEVVGFQDGPFLRVLESGQNWRDDDGMFVLTDGRPLLVGYACSILIEDETAKGVIISFRDIGNLKRAQQDALQASKLASVGQLAAGIAHEINTPIQYIGDNLRFLGDSFAGVLRVIEEYRRLHVAVAPSAGEAAVRIALSKTAEEADLDYLLEEIPQAIAQSLDGVGQVARIVLAMKEFSHPVEREKSAVDLNRAILNTLAVSRNEWKHFAEVETVLAEDLPAVMCLPGEINQVLLNLVVNAAHAIEAKGEKDKGHIVVTTKPHRDRVDISVADDGTGMSEAVKERIFDPFFTTKAIGRGTGQGLAICRDVVVTKHGGKIHVDTKEGEGTCFTVTLPIDGSILVTRSVP